MSVYTVFNLGTAHTQSEPNNTIAILYRDCAGGVWQKFVNDGPGTGGPDGLLGAIYRAPGNAQGKSMNPKTHAAVAAILAARPSVVNLAGHSRGAVMCHMIANDLSTSTDPAARGIQQINMVLLDPVNMSGYKGRANELKAGMKLGSYVSIVMENVNSRIFPSKTVRPMADHFRSHMYYHHMPGKHGSGTQPLTSAIGRATLLTMKQCLSVWGTVFTGGAPGGKNISEAYAGIHLENHVTYDEKGRVATRKIFDDPKGQSTSLAGKDVTWSYEPVSQKRVAAIVANYESMNQAGNQRTDLMNSPYFFNHYHMSAFADGFPAIYARFAGKPSSQGLIERELRDIEANYPSLAKSFHNLGMI